MDLLLPILGLLFTFYALAQIVDHFFVETLEIISKRLKLSSDIAGATFMAIGSSAPELFVSVLALFRVSEQQTIGAGTIVGSAIFNILVIIGISALFRRAYLTWQPVIRDLLFYTITILVLMFTFLDGKITLSDAVIYVGLYVAYLFTFRLWQKIFPYQTKGDLENESFGGPVESTTVNEQPLTPQTLFRKLLSILFFNLEKHPGMYMMNFLTSVGLIGFFSYFMVEFAVEFAHGIGLSPAIISLTVLAAGTSVPDLLSSIKVAKTGHGDMAIANAVGSNIFDIAIGLGLPWLIMTAFFADSVPVATENLLSSVVLLFATVVALLFLLVARQWEIGRYAGVFLILGYVYYLLTQLDVMHTTFCLYWPFSFCFTL